ncbi:hypothetical protein, partial [Pseudarthrobacter sp. CCNWLW207]|uniref:hypothetical protein n=1 Tax=Pseudarthrobacter sp. CCNWLW207 TaxID=3127468 RepID=UPI0030789889
NNRHTRHHHNQTTAMDRSGATFQTYPVSSPDANPYFRIYIGRNPFPTSLRHSNELPEFGLEFGGLAARGNQLFAVSLAAT